MPEGPEVKRTVDSLKKYKNYIIKKITINSGRYTKKNFKKQNSLIDDLPLKIIDINCKGKFIYFKLSNNMYIFNTLGMSGYWTTDNIKHNNVSFILEKKKKKTILHFNDVRNFGTLMYQTEKELESKLKCLGVDVIEDYNKFDEFKKRLERKRYNGFIGTALLDQKVTAGCGNYMRAEVLYHSKISPYRKLSDIKLDELKTLWYNLTRIAWIFYDIKKALKLKVLAKKDFLYKNYYIKDYYQYGYYANFNVYFQNVDNDGNDVIKEKMGPRTIHWVPNIQK